MKIGKFNADGLYATRGKQINRETVTITSFAYDTVAQDLRDSEFV